MSRSDDEGASWRDIFNLGSASVWGVDFVDRVTGWVVGNSNLYHTSTGGGEDGRAWQSQADNVDGEEFDLYDVAFADQRRGIAVGARRAPRRGPDILVTDDAGEHWRHVDLHMGPADDTWLTRVCMTSDGTGLAVGNGLAIGIPPLILTTSDAGATWTNVTGLVRATAPTTTLTIASCSCSASALYVVGAPAYVARSTDGGHTWTRVNGNIRRGVLVNSVLFVDGNHGWAAGYDRSMREILVFMTGDGGTSWTERVLLENVVVLDQMPTTALAALDGESILVIGDDPNSFGLEGARAFSFVTRDGGQTWMASTIPGGHQAFSDVDVVP